MPGTKEKYGALWRISLMCPASESAVIAPHVNIHGMTDQWDSFTKCQSNSLRKIVFRKQKREKWNVCTITWEAFQDFQYKIIFFKHKVSGNLLGIYFQIDYNQIIYIEENVFQEIKALLIRFSPTQSKVSPTILQFNYGLISIYLFVLTCWRLFQSI